jgi:hypothetical protein
LSQESQESQESICCDQKQDTKDIPRHVPAATTLPEDPASPITDHPAIADPASPITNHPAIAEPVNNTPVSDAAPSTPVTVFGWHDMFLPNKRGGEMFFHAPECTTAATAASSLKKDDVLEAITSFLGGGLISPEGGHGMGSCFLADAVAELDPAAFQHFKLRQRKLQSIFIHK